MRSGQPVPVVMGSRGKRRRVVSVESYRVPFRVLAGVGDQQRRHFEGVEGELGVLGRYQDEPGGGGEALSAVRGVPAQRLHLGGGLGGALAGVGLAADSAVVEAGVDRAGVGADGVLGGHQTARHRAAGAGR